MEFCGIHDYHRYSTVQSFSDMAITTAGLFVLMLLVSKVHCIPVQQFYNFGTNASLESNSRLGDGENSNVVIFPSQPYMFYSRHQFQLTVSKQ